VCVVYSILVGAPRDNITSPDANEEVRQLVRPGVVYQCPFTSDTDDCDDIKVDREGKALVDMLLSLFPLYSFTV